MTNEEILDDFRSKYKIPLSDYRPLCTGFVKGKEGITIWTEEGDVILYFPKQRPIGRWKQNESGAYTCSLCGTWIPKERRPYANYCLCCGAKMKEG